MTSITVPSTRPRLAGFLVGSVVLGSLATAVLAWIPTTPLILPLVALPISYVPAALAFLLVRSNHDSDELRAFRRRLTRWRIPGRWYVVGLLVGPAAHVTGVALATLWGGTVALHLAMLALLPLFLLTNLGEEIGWRGYALPQLQRRFSPLTSSLIVGLCWAAFHVVALAQNPYQPWSYVAVGSLTLIAMSVIMTWLFNHTESVVLMVACHAMYDVVAIGVVPLAGTTVPLVAFALSAAVLGLIAGILMVLTGPQLGRGRGTRAHH